MRSLFVLAAALGSLAIAACTAPSVGSFPESGSSSGSSKSNGIAGGNDDGSGEGTSATTSNDGAPAKSATKLTLTIATQGDGAGAITSDPPGVTCTGATCTGNFASGTSVTLTANPQAGSLFTGWTGGGCTGTSTCVTTLSAAAQVAAQFITLAGTWSGTYTHTATNFGCTFNNAGNLQQTIAASGTSFTSAVSMTGFQIKDQDCNLQATLPGASNASAETITGTAVSGSWNVGIDGVGNIQLPFTATIAGSKMTGKWTCSGCSGGFDISKDPSSTTAGQ